MGAIALVGVRLLFALGASTLPRLDHVPLDGRVLGFAFVTLVVTALVVGFAPALRLAGTSVERVDERQQPTCDGRTRCRTILRAMTVVEIALAIVLVAGAGWMSFELREPRRHRRGVHGQGPIIFDVVMPAARILPPPSAEPLTFPFISGRLAVWTHELGERLHAIRGVTAVGTAATLPFENDHDGALYIGVQAISSIRNTHG